MRTRSATIAIMPCFARGDAASAASRFARERDTIATRAPSAANACAHASPMPLLAPVTTTVRSANPRSMSIL
jgi:hypothetical protein